MTTFEAINTKVRNGVRLSEDDALFLYNYPDLLEVGNLANEYNLAKNGTDVFYNINRHINPTNVCAKSCKFCAFSRKPGEEGAYEYSIEDILTKAAEVVAQGATEVHMVGGLHPRWPFTKFLEIISTLKKNFPQLHVKAFTAVEIDWLAAKARMSVAQTLAALKEAGLDSLPGGGAEIFHPEIRQKICDTKTDANRWIEIHRTAHSLNLRSNCTMLYGHIESFEHRVDHMRRLRELQDETKGFNVFIPLAFQPYDNDMGIDRYTAGADDLRTIAVARLYLDNFKHIKSYWIMLGQDVAQLALNFGANDLDGTVIEEKISRMAGGKAGMAMGKNQIGELILKAGRNPVERDTLYRAVNPERDKAILAKSTPEQLNTAGLLLYKAEQGEPLDLVASEHLALHASLHQLGHCANLVKSKTAATEHSGLILTTIAPSLKDFASEDSVNAFLETITHSAESSEGLDLSRAPMAIDFGQSQFKEERPTLERLIYLIARTKRAFREMKISVLGLKALLNLSHQNRVELETIIEQLSRAGVSGVESSSFETEDDLTFSEVTEVHLACHKFDINTIGKVELSATYSGATMPFWQPFAKRLIEFRKLQEQSGSIAALKIEPAKGSYITPSEYLRAVALAKILVNNIPHILVPFEKIPTIKPRLKEILGKADDPAMKIAPLAIYFGATDFAATPIAAGETLALLSEMKISGLSSMLIDSSFESLNIL